METRDFKPIDRSEWPSGPWDDEPDRIEWVDEETGLPCLMKRNHAGTWCGYAAVNPGHPLHGIGYEDLVFSDDPSADIEVHGGLTYSGFCEGEICHVPAPGEPDDVFWYGFDCNHIYDVSPAILAPERRAMTAIADSMMAAMVGERSSHPTDMGYRDVAYVREQVTSLARQLAAAA